MNRFVIVLIAFAAVFVLSSCSKKMADVEVIKLVGLPLNVNELKSVTISEESIALKFKSMRDYRIWKRGSRKVKVQSAFALQGMPSGEVTQVPKYEIEPSVYGDLEVSVKVGPREKTFSHYVDKVKIINYAYIKSNENNQPPYVNWNTDSISLKERIDYLVNRTNEVIGELEEKVKWFPDHPEIKKDLALLLGTRDLLEALAVELQNDYVNFDANKLDDLSIVIDEIESKDYTSEVLSDTVLSFQTGSYKFDDSTALDRIISQLQGDNIEMVVEGYADDQKVGPIMLQNLQKWAKSNALDGNLLLSELRAEEVAKYLKEKLGRRANVTSNGMGATVKPARSTCVGNCPDRRVCIIHITHT